MIRETVRKLAHRIDQLSLRERILVLLTGAAILYYLGQVTLLTPVSLAMHHEHRQATATAHRIQALGRAARRLAATAVLHPNEIVRQQITETLGRIRAVDQNLHARTVGLVSPRSMSRLLEAILARQRGLVLIRTENLPPHALLNDPRAQANGVNLFSHPLELVFEGNFRETLDYLRALNRLPWHFYWDRFDLKATHYPENRATLVVHTLSLDRALLRS